MSRILTILIFFNVLVCFSQIDTYQFIHISSEDGLSQSSATAIEQDNLGQMWIGTRNGLNKYDGNKITVYKNEIDNEKSLSDNDILSIKQDKDGYIWIGTHDGLNRFNPKTETFKRYLSNGNQALFHNVDILDILEMSNEEIWFGTSGGLLVYNKSTDSFKSFQRSTDLNSIAGRRVLCIIELKNGEIFLGTDTGLSKLIGRKENGLQFKTIIESKHFAIQDLLESPSKTLLLGTKAKSVIEYNPITEHLSAYFPQESLGEKSKNVRALVFDNDDQLWVGAFSGIQVVKKNKDVQFITSNINDSKSLSHNSIKSLFKDKMGSIWIGTYYGGINIWDKLNVNFVNITQKPSKEGLSHNVVSSIESYKNFIFFGTQGGGITIQNKKNNLYTYLNQKNSPLLTDNSVKSMLLSTNNILWIGTLNKGISFYDVEKRSFIKPILPKKIYYDLKDVGVFSIKEDRLKNIWLGTLEKGLIKYNPTTKKIKTFKLKNNTINSLSSNLIRTLFIDSQQNVWVGTDKGVNKIDVNDTITQYFYDRETRDGDRILAVFEDSKKNIWVGTKSKGIFKLVDNSFVSKVLLSGNNNAISSIYAILEDNMHNLWVSTSQGLVSYNINSNKSIVYKQKEGVISNEFTENACYKIGESQFYFGGPAGVTYFDSNKIIKNNFSPQVLITDFKIDNETVKISDENSTLKKTIEFTETVGLSYKQGSFSISFAIPNFIYSNSNTYKYRLKGLDDKWRFTSNNHVSYIIQNSGNYTFEVLGANSEGIWNSKATKLNIKVQSAPWSSWWAFLIYFTAILIALYGLMRILNSKARLKNKLDLELIESDKIKQINKAKLEFFTNVSHEFRTPLSLILGPLHQILENYTGNRKIYKSLLVIESSANHLLRLINRLMDFRKIESNFFKLETAEGNIVKFLNEIYLSFKEFAKEGGYEYDFYSENEDIQVYYDRSKLERVFYNLISNAFRYTPKNGKILVTIRTEKKSVLIQVQDSGVGISKENRNKIFERFFEIVVNNEPDRNYNKGTGIGLSIVKNIVDLHKGEIDVASNGEKGSVFSVRLPLGMNHLNDDEIIKDFKLSDDLSQYVVQPEEQDPMFESDIVDSISVEEKQTILLVEDNNELRQFIRNLLKVNYNVIEAENGEIGFILAKKELPDLIVSDVVMPVMNGIELCSSLKKEPKTNHIPIILLTSRSSLIYKLEGLDSGADDYISKPFNIREFSTRIKNLLRSTSVLRKKYSTIDSILPENVVISSNDEILLKKAITVVEDNLKNIDFDTSLFCTELGVSRTKLFVKIKEWSKFTPSEFILHFRMKRASDLLEQGKINILQVSQEVGFKNRKYFSKCFKKEFGMSPLEFINKFNEG